MPASLNRKLKVREGHRASVKRFVSKAEEILISLTSENLEHVFDKLNHIRETLQQKSEILQTLDKEILNSVDEDKIIEEIETSDEYSELLTLTLHRLESSLVKVKPSEKQEQISLELQNDAEQPTISNPQTSQSHQVHQVINNHTDYSALRINLPKLDLRKFDGDISKWQTFWDSFQSSIHDNTGISTIDKFNYLLTLVEHAAADAISGLSLTAANYEDAISLLKHRFGNKQLIINRHMDLLLNLNPVTSNQNLGGLRQLYDTVEFNVRSLKSLGVSQETYGSILTSVIMTKLPNDVKLAISRESKSDQWTLDQILEIFRNELEAKERIYRTLPPTSNSYSNAQPPNNYSQLRRHSHSHKGQPSAVALLTNNSSHGPTCTYCRRDHASASCKTVTNIEARKDILGKYGRCFICLRRYHTARNCPSRMSCLKCNGRHHVSICPSLTDTRSQYSDPYTSSMKSAYHTTHQRGHDSRAFVNGSEPRESNSSLTCLHATNTTSSPVLLQTARAYTFKENSPHLGLSLRMLFDTGSQRTYITKKAKEAMNLPVCGQQSIRVKTFGSTDELLQTVDIVEFCLRLEDRSDIKLTAFAVPFICEPIQHQYVMQAQQMYPHLRKLWLADYVNGEDGLTVDILIGCDQYWKLLTGKIERGENGPTAIHTKVGWILSGPTTGPPCSDVHNSTLITTHVLKCTNAVSNYEDSLTGELKKFWDIESIGIKTKSIYEEFLEKISYNGEYYKVHLPWKSPHPTLPDNYELSLKRLHNLLKRLQRTPEIFKEYDSVIKDQLEKGIVELVPKNASQQSDFEEIHYIPHHPVIRQDKTTTRLRIVYDASAKSIGPSLNECVHAGPSLTQKIMDIMIRFRSFRVALTGDIEKAFLMVRITEEHRDVLRFLWIDNTEDQNVIPLRFTRAVFGVTSSPFLLNATIKHHIERYINEDPKFVQQFLNSMYVDDVTSGSNSEEETYELYIKSKHRLSEAGFNLRKFFTNHPNLRKRIEENEISISEINELKPDNKVCEDVETYTRTSLGSNPAENLSSTEQKILGIRWNFSRDEFIFDLSDIVAESSTLEPTKRNVISIASKFYDPLGVISPIIVQFKLLFQDICKDQRDWDAPLDGELAIKWSRLIEGLRDLKPIILTRCYFGQEDTLTCQLVGFSDASLAAYGAVVYLRFTTSSGIFTKFIASKTRVSPISKQTIPRLELLAALVLARLLNVLRSALEPVMNLLEPLCFSDSRIALYWITQPNKEWKQFVQNRVDEIRTLIPNCETSWKHCPGPDNPADILTRFINPDELAKSSLWWNGPVWLTSPNEECPINEESYTELGEECLCEMKLGQRRNLKVDAVNLVAANEGTGIQFLLQCTDFSQKNRLLRVTAWVLKFIDLLKSKTRNDVEKSISLQDISRAENLWLKNVQDTLRSREDYNKLCHEFNTFEDESGIIRCGGRLQNSSLCYTSKHPILLDKSHWYTTLVVRESHKRVLHGGVKATLTEVRSKYWIIRGRQFTRQLIYSCAVCKRYAAKPYQSPDPPPLPYFRVMESPAFSSIGLDYIGPLYIKSVSGNSSKVWICLYTCCVTRAIHLEVVPDLKSASFIRSFRRFTSRRSIPSVVVSDNASTFKPAAKEIQDILKDQIVNNYFTEHNIRWIYNLPKAPWWGGFFERLVRSIKECLKKVLAQARLTYDELHTSITEVEMILNSRPLSYITSEDSEEPLTPSHLICGHRIASLPDKSNTDSLDPQSTPETLTKRMKHVKIVMDQFWNRWRKEYLMELRNSHCHNRGKSSDGVQDVSEGDIVLVHDDDHPRGFWKLGMIQGLITSKDGQVRGAMVRIKHLNRKPMILQRPLKLLYPLEVSSNLMDKGLINEDTEPTDPDNLETIEPIVSDKNMEESQDGTSRRPKRTAATEGERLRRQWIAELKNS